MTENKRILIGEIATAHGIKGYVKVRCFAEDETLLEDCPVYMENGQPVSLKICHALKDDWAVEVDGVSDRNAAEALRGTKLYIDRCALPKAQEGEYYVEDLKGLGAVDISGNNVGIIRSVQNFGAGDLLDIKSHGGQDFYIPFESIVSVDLDGGVVTIDIPEII